MEVVKLKLKKILRGWKRCRSLGDVEKYELEKKQQKSQIAPEGCFSVYVGPKKQRFVVRTELVNHPLFKMLLEDAEMEYGFCSEGPILLPCEVDFFYKVLADIETITSDHDDHNIINSSYNRPNNS